MARRKKAKKVMTYPKTPRTEKNIFARYRMWLFAVMLILAFIVRFYNLPNIGLHYNSDEAVFLYEADWLNVNDTYGKLYEPMTSLKPMYIWFLSLSLKAFGHYDYAAIFVSALFGSLSVLLIYLITAKLYGWKAGLIAGYFLALFRIHIAFSRNTMADATLQFFILLTILIYLYAKEAEGKKSVLLYIATGILAGLTMQAKYVGVVVMLMLLVFELVSRITHKTKWKDIGFNYVFIIIGFLIVIAGAFIAFAFINKNYWYFLLGAATQLDIGAALVHWAFPNAPHFGNLEFATGSSNLMFNYARYAYYFLCNTFWPLLLLGLYFLVATIVNIARGDTRKSIDIISRSSKSKGKIVGHPPSQKCDTIWGRERNDIFLLAWFVITILIMLKIGFGVPRIVLLLIPVFAIVAARGLTLFSRQVIKRVEFRFKTPQHLITFIILVLIVIGNFIYSFDAMTYSNRIFRNAAWFLEDDNAEKILVNQFNFIGFYTGKPTDSIPADTQELLTLIEEEGYTHMVLYTWKFTIPEEMSDSNKFNKRIFDNCKEFLTLQHEVEEWKYPYQQQKNLNKYSQRFPILKRYAEKLDALMEKAPKQQQTLKLYRLDEKTLECIASLG